MASPAESEPALTARQRSILAVIHRSVEERGYPPTFREIAVAVGLGSPSSVAHHLDTLERLGLLRRGARAPRAVDARAGRAAQHSTVVPLLGTIAAGAPILAHEDVEDHLILSSAIVGSGPHFAVRVRGDSMTGAAICDGDVVVVRQQPTAETGDIVAALIDDEATVKTYRARGGHVELVPQNAAYEVIAGDEAVILGKVVCVLRRL
ncbi:transcriptional repressor LexA [Krasilnikovia sp. MM14-A1259]|uniref:transcriptional repressor LexA n=1 Tax=Krasilnikovia sp. MM14-A1259 TaxID=3373539 RepID=UPI00381DF74C